MRVLVISHAYAAPINRQKLAALARRPGLEVSLLLPRRWREGAGAGARERLTESGREEGYSIFAGDVWFPGRVTGHFYRGGLLRALREARPDVIHLEEEPWSVVAAQVLAAAGMRRPRPRLILFSFENLDLSLPWYYRAVERLALARAEVIIGAGEGARARLQRRGADPERLTVLPQFGLDPALFRPPGPGERSGGFTVGFIGRMVRDKGVDVLLRALAALAGEWRALLVGDGPARAECEALAASLGLGERVEFAGWRAHEEVPALLRRMDALALPARSMPTWTEQFGHVLIEAMSSGAVPVGSDSGEIPRVIGEEGLVFPEEDAEALAGALG
ncbi:MAG: glycosyltransferase, partial [bacterium]